LIHIIVRYLLPCLMLALSCSASAIGLGELRGRPHLGESLKLEITLLGADRAGLDASCFRLIKPTDDSDLPWLKKADLRIRQAASPVLEIRSAAPMREPVLRLAVQIGCGHEVSRDYVLLASPLTDAPPEAPRALSTAMEEAAQPAPPRNPVGVPSTKLKAQPAAERRTPNRSGEKSLPERSIPFPELVVGEPSLRLSTDLRLADSEQTLDAQREILRLEYRMLLVLQEQAVTQMATAEKLRSMESVLGELQQHSAAFAQRLEQGTVPADVALQSKPDLPAAPFAAAIQGDQPALKAAASNFPEAAPASSGDLGEWHIYAVLLGSFLGLGGWFGWRRYAERTERPATLDAERIAGAELEHNPSQNAEQGPAAGQPSVDLNGLANAVPGDLAAASFEQVPVPSPDHSAPIQDPVFSVSATTVDEHFEANPVMELADIMLSFGRVKGAAQALQEYIDHNPQEALQPWIRLMDVYRMAGMRDEFEAIARNLNQNFNVEIQQWDVVNPAAEVGSLDLLVDDTPVSSTPVAPRPQCLEDMPRIMSMVIELWPSSDVVGFLYQLLRDNRGGQRVGFALPVVEEILFLVELKETSNRIE
jgi:hypothetical protein